MELLRKVNIGLINSNADRYNEQEISLGNAQYNSMFPKSACLKFRITNLNTEEWIILKRNVLK